ncbi:hypothetical protein HK103_005217 [Boothiomyces macroporosus]|uniref:MYND-type domain-containing protein n=1 Tax=Boothiomyces macroporosus TaxID=261099 RepID=A0AAD5UFH4_9FUNG|nr:hypothetical protein HK103_005217 [Boothiomyces macroporosus]
MDLLGKFGARGTENVCICDFKDTGRGLAAAKEFKLHQEILSIPTRICWSSQTANNHSVIGPILKSLDLSKDDSLAIMLMYYKIMSLGFINSDGTELDELRLFHMSMIPTTYANSILLEPADMQYCEGSSLFAATQILKQQVQDDFQYICNNVIKVYPQLFNPQHFSLDLVDIVNLVYLGIVHYLECMVPFMDLFNGAVEVEQCHLYNLQTDAIQVIAGKEYKKGQQVFINYGKIANNRLLRLYGFALDSNPNDEYELVLSTNIGSPNFVEKVMLLKQNNLDSTVNIPMTIQDPLPTAILQYLRIQRASEEELEMIETAMKPVTIRNELEITNALIEALLLVLAGYRYKSGELENLIHTLKAPARYAAIVSLGEQRILLKSLQQAQIHYNCLNCQLCNTKQLGNKKCGKCLLVAYCSRECQVADWKTHKVKCKQ